MNMSNILVVLSWGALYLWFVHWVRTTNRYTRAALRELQRLQRLADPTLSIEQVETASIWQPPPVARARYRHR